MVGIGSMQPVRQWTNAPTPGWWMMRWLQRNKGVHKGRPYILPRREREQMEGAQSANCGITSAAKSSRESSTF